MLQYFLWHILTWHTYHHFQKHNHVKQLLSSSSGSSSLFKAAFQSTCSYRYFRKTKSAWRCKFSSAHFMQYCFWMKGFPIALSFRQCSRLARFILIIHRQQGGRCVNEGSMTSVTMKSRQLHLYCSWLTSVEHQYLIKHSFEHPLLTIYSRYADEFWESNFITFIASGK